MVSVAESLTALNKAAYAAARAAKDASDPRYRELLVLALKTDDLLKGEPDVR